MIRITATYPIGDATWDRWRSDADTSLKALETAYKNGQPLVVEELYRRKSVKQNFYFSRNWCFHGKCAYCETMLSEAGHPEIEHYRPKLGVTDENDSPIQVDYGSGNEKHRGYWWLAYSVTNLLPSCLKCNQASLDGAGKKIGKHNRFPVDGKHAITSVDIAGEKPMLLNPMEDDPADHLQPHPVTGLMDVVNHSKRGLMTIQILGLNARDELLKRRKERLSKLKMLLVQSITNDDPAPLLEVKELSADSSDFAAVARSYCQENLARFTTAFKL